MYKILLVIVGISVLVCVFFNYQFDKVNETLDELKKDIKDLKEEVKGGKE